MDQTKKNEKIAMEVSRNSILVNLLLSLFKFVAGILGHSSAMISDAVHSASDVFSTVIVIVGVKISGRDADANHRYGHERMECVASIILAAVLCVTGVSIGMKGVQSIASGDYVKLVMPGGLALAAAIISIGVKEGMYWYTLAAAKRINSGALKADAWHHRSDALSSIGSFVGILGSRLGFPIFDPIASVVICVFIVKAAYDIFKDAISKMTDEACDADTEKKMRQTVLLVDGVLRIDEMRTRMFGSRIYVDIEICVDGDLSLRKAHAIAENVHASIEQGYPEVKHCMVHVNPDGEE